MAIIVSDTFTRADNPTSLGTADTGQVWTTVSGTWGIVSNQAVRFDVSLGGQAIIETGFTSAITKVTLINPASLSIGAAGMGILFRYFDSSHYWTLAYQRFPGNANRLRLKRTYGGTATVLDITVTLVANDTISAAYCGSTFNVYVNDVFQGTYDDSAQPQSYGTQSGLMGSIGTLGVGDVSNIFDDFLVTTNGTCTPTYNCSAGACVDPGDGTGTYATLAACLEGCTVAASYNCTDGQCIDPGDGSGTYASLAACVASGCGGGSVVVETVRFDAGTGSGYYYVAPVVDSGDELRSKTVKSFRATGKFTNAAGEIYGYDVSDVVNTSDLEQGLNSDTGQIAITDTGGVAQTPRQQVNVPNAVLHTIRVVGDDTDQTERDRIDEIVTEQSEIGVRR